MKDWECRLQDWLRRNILSLGYGAVFLMGLFLRWSYLPHLAADLLYMNSSWFEALKAGGIAAVLDPGLQFTYSPLHLYLWLLPAKLLGSMDTHMVLKMIGLVFEGLNLLACWLLLKLLWPKAKALAPFIGFALIWLSPVMLWNVAAWGQTDVYYTLFCVLAVAALVKDKPEWGLCALGVALAWKLQAIFLLPLFVMAYFCGKKRFSLLWFLAVPGILILSGLPMTLVGESPLFAVNIYLGQTDLYTKITYNCPNLFAILGATTENSAADGGFSAAGIALCLAALALMTGWLIRRSAVPEGRGLVLLGAWCVVCCVFFLPRMHERYAIVGELLVICWAAGSGKPRAYACVVLTSLAALSAYAEYLFRHPFFPIAVGGYLNLLALGLLTWEIAKGFPQARRAAAAFLEPAGEGEER